jgi:hypothetical protein
LNPSKQDAARVKGLDDIATIISRCVIREDLYRRRYESAENSESKREFVTSHVSYRNALKALYYEIINFQATCFCFLSKSTFSKTMADTVKWHDWDTMLGKIKEQEINFKSIEEQWRDVKYEEECISQRDRHKDQMRGLRAVEEEVSRVGRLFKQARNDEERTKLLEWLYSVDPSKDYNDARAAYAFSTGDWLVKANSDFRNWEKAPNSLLWLHGRGIISPTS